MIEPQTYCLGERPSSNSVQDSEVCIRLPILPDCNPFMHRLGCGAGSWHRMRNCKGDTGAVIDAGAM